MMVVVTALAGSARLCRWAVPRSQKDDEQHSCKPVDAAGSSTSFIRSESSSQLSILSNGKKSGCLSFEIYDLIIQP